MQPYLPEERWEVQLVADSSIRAAGAGGCGLGQAHGAEAQTAGVDGAAACTAQGAWRDVSRNLQGLHNNGQADMADNTESGHTTC